MIIIDIDDTLLKRDGTPIQHVIDYVNSIFTTHVLIRLHLKHLTEIHLGPTDLYFFLTLLLCRNLPLSELSKFQVKVGENRLGGFEQCQNCPSTPAAFCSIHLSDLHKLDEGSKAEEYFLVHNIR